MPTHQRVVWFGRVDLTKFRELTSKVTFQNLDQQIEAAKILAKDEVDLAMRLRYLFGGPLGQIPCLFVFDDFEQGNLEERDGGYVPSSDMARILPALLKAIMSSNCPCPPRPCTPSMTTPRRRATSAVLSSSACSSRAPIRRPASRGTSSQTSCGH
jgi:hypothetical protein